jgi:hypothetical protein
VFTELLNNQLDGRSTWLSVHGGTHGPELRG